MIDQTYYNVGNEIIHNTEVLESNLFGYTDPYVSVKGDTTVVASPATQGAFKNCESFIKCMMEQQQMMEET